MPLYRKLIVASILMLRKGATAFVTSPSTSLIFPQSPTSRFHASSPSLLTMAIRREDEIRRKIIALKKEGKIKKDDTPEEEDMEAHPDDSEIDKLRKARRKMKQSASMTDYSDKISSKLGGGRKVSAASARLGRSIRGVDESIGVSSSYEKEDSVNDVTSSGDRRVRLGCQEVDDSKYDDARDDEEDLEEEAFVELVAQKLAEKRKLESRASEQVETKDTETQPTAEKASAEDAMTKETTPNTQPKKTTSGVGGSWAKNDKDDSKKADYTPVRGSWGAFPRPKNISKAYGGGRQIGAGVAGDLTNNMKSEESTRQRLREYREKVGIDVQSEKDNEEEIQEALQISFRAMQRGMYTTAVTSLEKITKYCSTNSQVGSQVFLELAMAYEASGRTEDAITVYTTLTTCRMETVKFNARRLLSGIEAMNFMRNEAKIESFSRKKISSTFIDTTGLANFADNFDDKYETAYVDLDKSGGFYKRLTESVVRTNREARQVLLRARGSGEVDRLRVVQAIRSMARHFDEAMSVERKREAAKEPQEESLAIMNGVPIRKQQRSDDIVSDELTNMDNFNLASPDQMVENLDGEWRLQLMADKKGDTVKYFNSTLSWQKVDSSGNKFESLCPAAFLTTSQMGTFTFDGEKRVLSREVTSASGAPGFLSAALMGSGSSRVGAPAAILSPQQIISVDSALCISRLYGLKVSSLDNVKDFYCVWRRVETGTYSEAKNP